MGYVRFIRKKVERVIRLTGFPLKTCGNDKQKQPFKIVILGLDPGIQDVFNLNTKDPKKRQGHCPCLLCQTCLPAGRCFTIVSTA